MGFFSNMNTMEKIGLGARLLGAVGDILGTASTANNRARLEDIESNVDNKFHLISEFSNRLSCDDEDE